MQQIWESLAIALRALWANKLRSALTILCVAISVASIILVVFVGDGMDFYVKDKIASQGSNVFTVQRLNMWEIMTDFDKFLQSLKNPNLTLEDLEALRQEVTQAEFIDAAIERNERINNGRRFVENVEIRGRSEEYPAIGEFTLASGRHLSHIDVQQRREVCVLGWDVVNSLFPDADPLNQTVRIAGFYYTVIGVCEKKGSILGSNQNIFAFIPVSTHLKHFGSTRHQSLSIPIRATSMETFAQVQEQARIAMRIRHKLRPSQEDDFYISTSEQLLSLWETISRAVFGSLFVIVGVSLVVGGIIIMNVMLVAVTERTREIGIRKALGAKRRNITMQFVIESITLTIIGGVIGIVGGFMLAYLAAAFFSLPYRVALWSIIVALAVSFIVGLFFGVYPARKAARLDPVEALRYE